ncbi:circularly permuted type 2 ATP-grasp protein [Viridibacterium curvum]|uniref:Circularly permuted type 2 ATP-grasp protein n=1 Tax=Viridibacterium curvum TaxID=1101404 RepID=A0ABP9Q986_9RHOO
MSLLDRYTSPADRYDELLGPTGTPREHWTALISHLEELGPRALQSAREAVQRQIGDNGVTYNVYADPRGADRLWDLDLVPQVLPAEEWAQIAAGIRQRATLLNATLRDLYGPQNLVAENLLPASLLRGHPGFLRPCHGIEVPGDIHLHLYAADIARSPDGRWWVVSDRTQGPSGAGYALENRALIGAQFPELLRELRVQPLGGFFQSLHDALAHWAPRDDETPLIVLLTPGALNETYFEHAYLARMMGIPLVEGQDLTVRHGSVFLKTLAGLRRVHAILRRVDDSWCDPLELRSDSALGVPGLVDAARRGNVLIANALGSGVIESGALLGFLPALCKHLLGEELALPSVATWWCGEEDAREEVIARLDDLVLKPAYGFAAEGPIFGGDLDEAGRAALIQRIREQPRHFVGQEMVRLSRGPVWGVANAALEPRLTGLRVYAAATPNGYIVMPGGLTRVAGLRDARVITIQRGGGSKDTWITGSAQEELPFSARDASVSATIVTEHDHGTLASRTGEAMFWLARYAERADCSLRLLRCGLRQQLAADDAEWPALLAAGRRLGILPVEDVGSPQATLLTALRDTSLPGSPQWNLLNLLRLARSLRDRLAPDSWRIYNRLERLAKDWARGTHSLSDALEFIDQCLQSLITLSGYSMEHMTRDAAWRFQSVGRRLERMQFLASAQQLLLTPEGDQVPGLASLIDLADAVLTYRRRYQRAPELGPVAELLLIDHDNPRAFLYQIESLADHIAQLPGQLPGAVAPLQILSQRLAARRPGDWVRTPSDLAALRNLLAQAWQAGNTVSDLLHDRYFTLVATRATAS